MPIFLLSPVDVTEMLTLVARHHNMGCHLEVGAEQVAQGVVFLKQDEIRAVGHPWHVPSDGDEQD